MTQELRSLYEITGDIKDINTVLVQRNRLEKAERLLFELREAAAAVVSNEEHAFSGGMRKYAEGSQTWQVYEDLRIAMEASK